MAPQLPWLAAPLLLRAALLLAGAGGLLEERMETDSPLLGGAALRRAWAVLQLVPPEGHVSVEPHNMLLALWGWLASRSQVLAGVPGLAADAGAAWLLGSAFGRPAGRAYLWSPFALLACVSGSAAPLHNFLVLAAMWAACRGRPLLAGAALAGAVTMSIYSTLFAVPLLVLLWWGPAAGFADSAAQQQEPGQQPSPGSTPGSLASELTFKEWVPEKGERDRSWEQGGADAAAAGAAGAAAGPDEPGSGVQRGGTARCALFLLALVATGAVLIAAEEAVAAQVSAAVACTPERQEVGCVMPARAAGVDPVAAASQLERRAVPADEGSRLGRLWFVRRLRFVAEVEDILPNIGLAWYFFVEIFPQFRGFFLYVFHAMPAALTLPLALRFPRRPLFALLHQALANCLLGPYPTYGDIALWLALLPAAAPQVALLRGKCWWALAFLGTLLFNSATYQLWWIRGIANPNFLYGMNLAWGACQALLSVQLVKQTAQLEAVELRQPRAQQQ